VSEEQLRAAFSRFGDIIYVKIPAVGGLQRSLSLACDGVKEWLVC
jgi:hypothetical protein